MRNRPGVTGAFEPIADAIMRQRGVRAGGGDRGERDVAQGLVLRAERFQTFRRADLGEAGRGRVEPCEKFRQRHGVAPMRGFRPRDLGVVLGRLHQRQRIGQDDSFAASLTEGVDQQIGRCRLVEGDAATRLALAAEVGLQPVGRMKARQRLQMRAGLRRDFVGLDIEPRAALARDIGEGERQRRVRDVGAAQVEDPGDVMGVADQRGVGIKGFGETGQASPPPIRPPAPAGASRCDRAVGRGGRSTGRRSG